MSPKNCGLVAIKNRIEDTSKRAQDAFWEVVAREFKDAKYSDIDPMIASSFDDDCMELIKHWVKMNTNLWEK